MLPLSSGGGGGSGPLTAWESLGTHPQAAAQSTTLGQKIRTLKTFNGMVFAGYGDIGENTGPITINPYDPATDAFLGAQAVANSPAPTASYTEAIYVFREFGGKLYAPHIDPRGADGGYAVLTGGAWSDHYAIVDPLHVTDFAQLGTDLYLCGYNGEAGKVWKSTDGGSTFTTILSEGVAFWWMAPVAGKIVVQAFGDFAKCRLYNGSAWADGPSVDWYTDVPEVFNGALVVAHFSVGLRKFDGTTASTISGFAADEVLSITSDEAQDYCYVLKTDLTVQRSADLSTWEEIATSLPAAASAVTVCDGFLYVGTTDSKLWRSTGALPA